MRISAICGLLAGPVLIGSWIVGALAQPDEYSFLHHASSDTGADTASSPWISNIGNNVGGLLLLGFAIGLRRSLGSHRWARVGSALLVVVGLGLFLLGIFRIDCREIDAGCDTPDASWHGTTHGIVAGITVLAILLAPFVLSRALKLTLRWSDLWIPTLALGIGAIAALVAGNAVGVGLGGLLSAIASLAWLAVLSIRMLLLARDAVPEPRPAVEVQRT